MSSMIEVYFKRSDKELSDRVRMIVARGDGVITFSEDGGSDEASYLTCLTVEFEHPEDAEKTKLILLSLGLHIEGPSDY